MRALIFSLTLGIFQLYAADSADPMFWSSAEFAEIEKKLASQIDPTLHMANTRPTDSVLIIHRNGESEAEIHEKLADLIFIRSGEGMILVGGTMLESHKSAENELRGKPGAGGKTHKVKAGDMVYVPANTVHQFLTEPGKTFTAVIVKITPTK